MRHGTTNSITFSSNLIKYSSSRALLLNNNGSSTLAQSSYCVIILSLDTLLASLSLRVKIREIDWACRTWFWLWVPIRSIGGTHWYLVSCWSCWNWLSNILALECYLIQLITLWTLFNTSVSSCIICWSLRTLLTAFASCIIKWTISWASWTW